MVLDTRQSLQARQQRQKDYYDRGTKPLAKPLTGQMARIRPESDKILAPALITAEHSTPRSYLVTTPEGATYRRNRRDLLPTAETPPMVVGASFEEEHDIREPQENTPVDVPSVPETPVAVTQDPGPPIVRSSARGRTIVHQQSSKTIPWDRCVIFLLHFHCDPLLELYNLVVCWEFPPG